MPQLRRSGSADAGAAGSALELLEVELPGLDDELVAAEMASDALVAEDLP